MRKLLVTLDDDLDLWLKDFPNQNEVVRIALAVYKEHITTEVLGSVAKSYRQIRRKIDVIAEQLEALALKSGAEFKKDDFTDWGV